jgi:hypothetical protein
MKLIYITRRLALAISGLIFAAVSTQAQITFTGQGIQLVSQSNGTIQVNDGSGNGYMILAGCDFYGNASGGSAYAEYGTASLVSTGGTPSGILVNYTVQNDSTGTLSLSGLFTFPSPNCVHIHYTIGAPSTANLSGNEMYRWSLPSYATATYTPIKLGTWTRDANGGVPYETPDSIGFTVGYSSGTGLLKTPNAVLAWSSVWEMNLPPVYAASTWTADAYFYVPSSTARSVIESAAALGLPVSADVWTNQPYNIWSSSSSPLSVYAQAANTSGTAKNITLTWTAHNYSGTVVASGTDTEYMNPGQNWTDTLSIPAPTQGIIFVEVDASDGTHTAFSTTNVAVMPPYTFGSGSESIFGLSSEYGLPSQTAELPLLQRMGVRWMRGASFTNAQAQSIGMTQNYFSNTPDSTMEWDSGNTPGRQTWIDSQLTAAAASSSPSWEFSNEMNLEGGLGNGTEGANYAAWLSLIHGEKVSRNSSVQIISGGLGGMDTAFTTALYNAGGWPYFDAFGLHPARGNLMADSPGENNDNPNDGYWTFFGAVKQANATLAQYGTKPLYLTESYSCTSPNNWWTDTYRQAAENVVLSFALAMEEKVKTMFFYQLDDSVGYDVGGVAPTETDMEYHYGLLNRDLSPKPSLLAYCTIAQALDQATFAHWMSFENPNTHGLMYNTPRGPMAVLWNRADGYVESVQSATYASPQPWADEWPTKTSVSLATPSATSTVTVLDSIGESSTVTASNSLASITLDGAPRIVYGLASTAGQSVIIDNNDTTGFTKTGSWTVGTSGTQFYLSNYLLTNTGQGSAQATYTPHIGATGSYAVYIWYPAFSSNSAQIPVTINYAGGSAEVYINEKLTGGQWVNLGTYDFAQGITGNVVISNVGTTGNVVADAVSFVQVTPTADKISWKFNEVGTNPTANDFSGNGYNGTSTGNITGSGTSYSGFTSTSNYVSHAFATPFPSNLTADSSDMWDQNFTFIADISHSGSNTTNLIARGGSLSGGDNAWQLSMSAPSSGKCTFSLVMGMWDSECAVATSSAVTVTPSTTYQVALVWTYSDSHVGGPSEFTIGYTVYLTPTTGGSAVSVLSGSHQFEAGPNATYAGSFFIGGAGNGYYSQFSGGSFGGNISNVELITGSALTGAQIRALP